MPKRYVMINGSRVVDAILLNDPKDIQTNLTLVQSDTANINDIWNGTAFTRPPAPKPEPNWGEAKVGFLADSGYQRVTLQTSAIIAVTRVENAVVDYSLGLPPTYSLFKSFWDSMIAGLLIKPTNAEISSWNTIASATFMLFSFDKDGKMVLS